MAGLLCIVLLGFPDYLKANEIEPVRIASIYALSGSATLSHASSMRGIRCGVRAINESGGALGRPLELIAFDNESSPIGAKVTAEAAIRQGVTAIIGSAWSSHTLAAARVAQAAGIPLITNISTHPDVTRIGDRIFRICFTDDFQGQVMATFAREALHAGTAFIFVDVSSDYSMNLADEFERRFVMQGGVVLKTISYKEKQMDFRQTALQIESLQADVCFIPGYLESAVIIREARKLGMTAIPLGGDGWDMSGFIEKSGGAVEGAYYCTHWTRDKNNKPSEAFLKRCPKPGNSDIGVSASALGYDAVLVLADAIKRAGSTDTHLISQALAQTQHFEGVTGDITFGSDRNPAKDAVIMKIVDNHPQFVKRITHSALADQE